MGRVLVVDDDPAMVALFRTLLADGGHEPAAAPSLAEVSGPPPDVVITDLVALGEYRAAGARDVVREVRARFPGVPVIVCTAHDAAAGDAPRIGADAVVTKPFDVGELLALVDRLVGERR